MRKLLLCAVMLFGTVCMANAQDKKIQFGVRAGMNLNSLSGGGSSSDSRIGFHAGAIMDWNVAENLYVQPGLFFTTRGAKGGSMKINTNYLQIPISVSYRFPVSDAIKIDVNAGPYFAMGIGGKIKGFGVPEFEEMEDYGRSEDEGEYNDDELEDYLGEYDGGDFDAFGDKGGFKRFDAGLRFGAGVHFQKFSVGLIYDLGLTKIAKKGDQYKYMFGKVKNSSFQISLGYNF